MHQAIARALSARHDVGLAALELVPQQLAEQVVVAIPLAAPVEAHHEAVRAPERLERLSRPRRLEHGVAKSAAQALEDGGVGEELHFGRRQPRQELEAEVLGDEPIVAGEGRRRSLRLRPRLYRKGGEVQPCGPAFRPLGQLGELASFEFDACTVEQQPGLLLVQAEVRHADLVHQALRPPTRERQRRLLPTRHRDRSSRPGHTAKSSASTSRQDGLPTACRSSSTSTSGLSTAASAAPTREDAHRSMRFHPGRRARRTPPTEAARPGGSPPRCSAGTRRRRRLARRVRPTRTDADQPRPTAPAAWSCRTRRVRPRSRTGRSPRRAARSRPPSPRCPVGSAVRRA